MGFYAEPWLREARDKIKSFPDIASDDFGPDDFAKLAEAVEKAIKAALIENHGGLPTERDDSKLVSICQTTGLWDVLPPALKGLVQVVEAYGSTKNVVSERPSVETT